MAKRIRLVFGACYLPAAQHDLECKLHLMHGSELLAKCGSTSQLGRILIGAYHETVKSRYIA
jgi:hypothetical protein